jgi:DNA-binding SARP family transcriptional activator
MEGGAMRLRALGPLAIRVDRTESTVAAHRDRTLLAMLMLDANQVVPLGALVDAVWGADPPSTARAQLHSCVSRLRRMLPADRLRTAPGGYLLAVAPEELDLLEFESLVGRARRDVAGGRLGEAVEGYRAALALWQGEAFTGVDSQPVRAAAATWEESRSRAWEECVEAELALGRSAELVQELTGLVRRYPTRERLRGQLMLALYRAGRQADALAVYRETRALLAEELGVEPGPELVELHRRLLRSETPEAAVESPAPPAAPTAPRCLPRDVSDFVGREDVLGPLLASVPAAGEPAVVLAVDGMPGVGKTALAVRLAHLVADRYPDGALHLDLHGHSAHAPLDPAAALNVLLRQLEVPGERIPESLDGRVARWRSELADRRVLLLLDNAATSEQVAPLLPGADGCLTLITSRRRLVGLDGARPVSLEVLTPDEAVALLSRIAGARVGADPSGAAEVARVCGYLALAIRLAAARLAHRPTWTVRDLLARLESTRPVLSELAVEGRSLDAAFALSYQNVGEPERRMFRMLGLHPGEDFDLRAAAALADLDLDVRGGTLGGGGKAAAVVDALVDAHLLQEPSAGRYRLHDLLREYARGLAETEAPDEERAAAVARLVECCLHTAATAAAPLDQRPFDYRLDDQPASAGAANPPRYPFGPVDAGAAVAWFTAERANLVAVVALAERLGMYPPVWRLARAMSRFLFQRGYGDELLAVNTAGLRAAQRLGDRYGEAAARTFQAAAYTRQGRFLEATDALRTVLAYALETGDRYREAATHYQLGSQAQGMSLFPEAVDRFGCALRMNSGIGYPVGEAMCLAALGELYRDLGRLDEAMTASRGCLRIAEQVGSPMWVAVAWGRIGAVELDRGRLDEAQRCLRHSVRLMRELGNLLGEAEMTVGLAEVCRARDDLPGALVHHRRALDIAGGVDRYGECIVRNSLGTTLRLAGEVAAARDQHRQALAMALEIRNRLQEGRALAGLAELAAAEDPGEAVRLRRAALEIFQELGVPERHALAALLDQDG